MNFFRVDFDDGDYLTTGFNGDLNDAREYYLGHSFEKSDETMHKVIKVEQIF